MKQQTAPKWLLTTALLAVLGANYSFQANSLSLNNENGLFEMSSETSSGRGSSRGGGKAESAPTPTTTSQKPPASATVTASSTATVSAAAESKP